MFDNTRHRAVRVPDDASVTRRVFHFGRQQRHAVVVGHQPPKRFDGDQRDVRVQDQDARSGIDCRQRLNNGVPRSQLLVLLDPGDWRLGKSCAHRFRAVTADHYDAIGFKCGRAVDYVSQQRFASQQVQRLGYGGTHPRTLAGGQDDHVQCRGHQEGPSYRGLSPVHGHARSSCAARPNSRPSPPCEAASCTPIGRPPDDRPSGSEMAG